MSKYKFATIVPLVGGMSIGNSMALDNKKPEYLLSYPAFSANEEYIKNYWPDVNHYLINEETNKLDLPEDSKKTAKDLLTPVDIVSAVPPCAGLSLLNAGGSKNPKAKKGSDAEQNDWMYKTTHFVLENIKPKVLFGENAPGLYTKMGSGVVKRLSEIAKQYKYSFSLVKTDTSLHGIPQKRRRTFYFFWKSDEAPLINWYNRDVKVLDDFLADIDPSLGGYDKYANKKSIQEDITYKFMYDKYGSEWKNKILNQDKASTCLNYIEVTGQLNELIELAESEGDERQIRLCNHIKNKVDMGKGYWDWSPHVFTDKTNAIICRNMECGVHPTEERWINLRECAALMGLPDDFELPIKKFNIMAQNVPTCTARDMTYEIIKFLDGDLKSSGKQFIKQDNWARRIEDMKEAIETKKLF